VQVNPNERPEPTITWRDIMNGSEKLIWEKEGIRIANLPLEQSWIMHVWEDKLMEILAKKATENGGDILELGFGMGISATYVQQQNIKSHTIIEVHPEMYEKAVEWSKTRENVTVLFGSWQDVIPTLNKKFDGILHDTHADDYSNFLLTIKNICKEGCVVSFYKNKTHDDKFFDILEVKVDEVCDVNNSPYLYPRTENERSIFKNNTYKIKSVYFHSGIFTSARYRG
jgi:hypothetical protein